MTRCLWPEKMVEVVPSAEVVALQAVAWAYLEVQ